VKEIVILGSTGSIGRQACDVVRTNPDMFRITGLCCNSDIDTVEAQISEFGVKAAAVMDHDAAKRLASRVDAEVLAGMEGVMALAAQKADITLNALVGSVGISPTIASIRSGNTIALANKETLVSAGGPVMKAAAAAGVRILPVDSEHSAIFQCLQGNDHRSVKKLILTCSGGAFRDKSMDDLKSCTVKDALSHPVWAMGRKITIDSASLMNKGLEVIEAHVLFRVPYNDISVLIHPQSIIHSMVEYIDGSNIAQLSCPDMRLPIQYALAYPKRIANCAAHLNLAECGGLSFAVPDHDRFRCLGLAYEAGREGGSMPCVMNAANEIAVSAFLEGKIGFLDIPEIIERAMERYAMITDPSIEEIIELDKRVKRETSALFMLDEAVNG
jgi:1-deoxy-D-xylulose-5-phosphate reductoisomerase